MRTIQKNKVYTAADSIKMNHFNKMHFNFEIKFMRSIS